jgi:hypothetical protein
MSPTTELSYPTSAQELVCAEHDRDEIVATMESRLPKDGATAGHLRGRFDLMRATRRLLDSRVLEAAATALDQDVAQPLVEWLSKYHDLREAAAKTAGEADQQVLVVLKKAAPFTSTQNSEVTLYVADKKVATVEFRLEVTVELGETSVAVRHGAIEELVCAVARASASFSLDGCPKPLWKPKPVSLPDVHLAVRPAFAVPLVEVPRPRPSAEQPVLRRLAERPPVPGGRGRTRT